MDDHFDAAEGSADDRLITDIADDRLDSGKLDLERLEVERSCSDATLGQAAEKMDTEEARAPGHEPAHACLATTASIRAPARSDGPSRPETFERPPRLARDGTSTCAIGSPACAALTTISVGQP